ncbi:MAG: sulfite exporter TauE/SafE family protein [Candidatus Asgardarchaeia archaeon]
MISLLFIIILISLGFLVGFLIGLTGMGGGAITTPTLIFLGISPITAVGTDLLFSAITKFFGFLLFVSKKNIDITISLKLFVGSLPAVIIGSYIIYLSKLYGFDINYYISYALGLILIVSAIITFLNKNRPNNMILKRSNLSVWKLMIIGFVVGFLVQFTSVGSGTLIVFFLLNFTPLSPHIIVGTNVFYGFLLTLTSAGTHYLLGTIDFQIAFYLTSGALLGIYFGVNINSKIPKHYLKKTLSIMVLIMGFLILVKAIISL